jgi:UDP-GlcNAc:undecaprenyl-phosphate/decaprenyl-phosphate GlcNAc-1-phosphate transferase
MTNYVICFVMSAITTYFTTILAIKIANKLSFYDIPKKRNMHQIPVPMLGGLALLVSIILNTWMFSSTQGSLFIVGIMGAICICGIGLVDDKYTLHPFVKVGLQMVLITFLYTKGVRVDFLTFPSNATALFLSPWVSFVATQVWMITIINMFNIIDGIDGLAVGISIVTAVILCLVSVAVSPIFVTFLLIAMAGSCTSFLKFNFYPAKIFLGDSGSLLLGFLFAFVSVVGVMKSTISCLILVFVFAIPLMDLLLSVLRRILKRRHIFYPDLEHIHHQLVRRGVSVPKAVLSLYALSGFFGGIAVISSVDSHVVKVLVGVSMFVGVFVYFSYLQRSFKRFGGSQRVGDSVSQDT